MTINMYFSMIEKSYFIIIRVLHFFPLMSDSILSVIYEEYHISITLMNKAMKHLRSLGSKTLYMMRNNFEKYRIYRTLEYTPNVLADTARVQILLASGSNSWLTDAACSKLSWLLYSLPLASSCIVNWETERPEGKINEFTQAQDAKHFQKERG